MGALREMEESSPSESCEITKIKNTETIIPTHIREKVSNFQAATHLFKGSVGAGLFAMGDCFKNGGLLGATIFMPIIGAMVVHCEHLLINASVFVVKKSPGVTYYDYPETVQKCFEFGPKRLQRFANTMKIIVEVFLSVTQFGFCSVFFVFIIKNLYQVLEQHNLGFSEYTVGLITLLPALIPSLMTNLKLIAPVSLLASFCLMFGVFATLTIAFFDGPMPPISERNLITNIPKLALFFGTAQFAFEGIAVVLPLRNSMKEPQKFISRYGVLNLTICFVIVLFIITGSISYMRWGENIQGIISLNLDPQKIFSQAVKIISASGVYLGIPIQFMVLIETIWPRILNSYKYAQMHPVKLQVLIRFILMILVFGAALIVPKLSLFISLLGALFSTCLAVVIPVLIDFINKATIPNGLNGFVYLKNSIIFAFGVLGMAVGTYQSIIEIIASFHK